MDDILDKLKILNYQAEFCRPKNFKPLPRFYFNVQSSNPNEQLYHFTSLFSWLVRKLGDRYEEPGQFDDPNATAASLAAKLRDLDIPFDQGLNKLKQGHGDAIIYVLQTLVDRVLAKSGFVFKPPVHKVEDFAEEAEVDADAEVTAEAVEDDLVVDEEEEEEFSETVPTTRKLERPKTAIERPMTAAAKPKVDPAEWKVEVERVTPLLRVQIPNDNKDWRIHLEAMRHHKKAIDASLVETQGQLGRLHVEIEKTLDKIVSREKYINSQFENQAEEHRILQDQLSELKQKYGVANTSVTELTSEMSRVSEELDRVKANMDEIGSGMTDSKPLVQIKQAVTKLKGDIKQMDLRIGVIQQTLLHAKLKSKGTISAAADPASMMFIGL
ncbi:intra-flagellar transport protein 57 [Gaertneriomyces semiglobifer]|nr:intra-flagellar transport protein 57 [Gaertneriomyces semiglobifer]